MSKLNYFGNGSGNKIKQTESKGHRIKSQTCGAMIINNKYTMKNELFSHLNRSYDRGYHSVATMYATQEVIYGNSEGITREFRDCLDKCPLTNHQLSHLLYIASWIEEGHFWVYNDDIGDVLLDLFKIGLESNDSEVNDMAVGLIETFTTRVDLIEILKNHRFEEIWMEEYRKQVIIDVEEDII